MFNNLDKGLVRALNEAKYLKPTKVQEMAIPLLLQGKSVLAQAKTGSGKTAAYLIPAIQRRERTLVLVPTRELAYQVMEEARKLSKYTGNSIGIIIGGVSYNGQEREAKSNIVIGTPGRILDLWGKGILDLRDFTFLVVDEVDRMFDMGFIEDVKIILNHSSPNLYGFFSATVPTEVERLAKEFGGNIEHLRIDEYKPVEEVEHSFIEVKGWRDKLGKLREIVGEEKTIIFVNTKKKAEELYYHIFNDFRPALLHGDLSQTERFKNLRLFKSGRSKVLVSTDLASRGIDIVDVDQVINFDLPRDIETYIHRVGRTGRMGRKGKAITFYTRKDILFVNKIKELIKKVT